METLTVSESGLHPFHMDDDALLGLQAASSTDLQLLRLRLRFGLPQRVRPGQSFRVVVDLVDEMGQPPPATLQLEEDVAVCLAIEAVATPALCSLRPSDNQDTASRVRLEVEERPPASRGRERQHKWVFHAVVHAPLALDGAAIRLTVSVKQSCPERVLSSFQQSLQHFCVNSVWLDDRVLVLSLRVELLLDMAAGEDPRKTLEVSTVSQRVFCVASSPVGEEDKNRSLVVVEEHYGDTMGAHVWDASVLLSFALLQTGVKPFKPQANSEQSQLTTLELGSGCGLFVSVLQAVVASRGFLGDHIVATERSESTQRLRDNLVRNAVQCKSGVATDVLALEWGAPFPEALLAKDLRVVFAADVLYNWAAHEALLATLDALVSMQENGTQVILAHKRRGKASAEALEALASGTSDSAAYCGEESPRRCRWSHWHVHKLAEVGPVAFYRLTPRLQR